MDPTLTIGTPCYNEAASLPAYFERMDFVRQELTRAGWQHALLLINDGSQDNTPQLLNAYAMNHAGTRVVDHPRNLGYGAAIKTALALAETDWIVFVDSDSNYDQRLILELVQKAGPDTDLVNVSILAPGGGAGYPWYRLLLSSIATAIYKVTLPRLTRGVYTMTCGFRLYRRELVPKVFPHADDFVATAEIMVRALKSKARVVEFPATNARREHGVSKMKVVRVSLHHLKLALSALFGGLGPPRDVATHLQRIGVSSTAWKGGP